MCYCIPIGNGDILRASAKRANQNPQFVPARRITLGESNHMLIMTTLVLSFIGLFWASNHLVSGSIGIAHYYQIPPLMIGLTLVAICSAAPELMVGISSAMDGRNDLALGNAIGSSIANIGLILGLTTLIRPLTMRSRLWRREYPLLFAVMLLMYSLMIDGYLSVLDGCLLLFVCLILIGYLLFLAKQASAGIYAKEFHQMIHAKGPLKSSLLRLAFGLTVLPLASHFFVGSLVNLAAWSGASELFIGLTITAIATSLPQATTSLIAAFKGYNDIAIGNIIGSNIFILLLVMAFPGIINPSPIHHSLLWHDIPFMFILTAVLLLINSLSKQKMTRWHGGLLLLIYCSYLISLVYNAIPRAGTNFGF